MILAIRLAALLLIAGCTTESHRPARSPAGFDLLSLHWEAPGPSSDVRWCDLVRTGERIALEPEVVLGIRGFSAARVVHDEPSDAYFVQIKMTPEGRRRIKAASSANVGRRLAIVIDDDVVALATVWRTIDQDELNLMPTAEAGMAENLAKRINAAIEEI